MSEPQIEGYTDLAVIGRGGFAVVYRARREALDQDVAVKVLSLPDLTERDLERFTRECRAAGNLAWHPHVVAVYDSGTTSAGQPYLAMEYLDNGSLADRLAETGPLPWADVVDIGIQIAGALGAAHAAGTLHRDMKPENILVGHFGEALLADFGIAAVEGHTRTATGHAAFTVTHVAPEILKGHRPDERTDLYGLASTLHTLLTGTTPFATGDPDEPVATVITRVLTEPAPHLDTIPPALADLLDQALAKDPDTRPQTAEALGEALQQIQRANDLPVTTLRLTRTPRTTTPAEATTPGDATGTPAGDANPTIQLTPVPADEPAGNTTADAADDPGPTVVDLGREPTFAVIEPEPTRSDPNATITLTPSPDTDQTRPPPPDTHQAAPSPESPAPDAPAVGRSKTPFVIGIGIAAVLALAAGAFLVLGGGDDNAGPSTSSTSPSPTSTTTPAAVPPATHEVGASVDVVNASRMAGSSDGAAWVTSFDDRTITRVAGGQVTDTLQTTSPPQGISSTGDTVWVAAGSGGRQPAGGLAGSALRIDPSTRSVVASVPVGGIPGVAASPTAVWTTSSSEGLFRIDPSTNAVVSTTPRDDSSSTTVTAATDQALWIASTTGSSVQRIDPATGETIATLRLRGPATAITAVGDDVWVVEGDARRLTHIDAATNEVDDPIDLPSSSSASASSVAASPRAVWVGDKSGDVTLLDPETQEVLGVTEVVPNGDMSSLAIDGDALWVLDSSHSVLHRLEPA